VWADRLIAALIDFGIVVVAVIVINLLFGAFFGALGGLGMLTGKNEAASSAIGGIGCLGCIGWMVIPAIVYFAVGLYLKVFLVSKRGYSIGQGVAKIRVVTPQGSLVPVGTLVLRLLVQTIFFFVPFIGWLLALLDLLWPLWDGQRQTLHDKAVGTFVIKVA
jgi:RDD family.